MTRERSLTPQQVELMQMLAEEAGEIVQICMKALRHGASSYHPADQSRRSNSMNIADEVADLCTVVRQINRSGLYPKIPTDEAMDRIWKRKLRYTHHQPK